MAGKKITRRRGSAAAPPPTYRCRRVRVQDLPVGRAEIDLPAELEGNARPRIDLLALAVRHDRDPRPGGEIPEAELFRIVRIFGDLGGNDAGPLAPATRQLVRADTRAAE